MFKIDKFIKKRKEKIGLPPGTPVYTGEKIEKAARITLMDYDEEHVQEKEISKIEECCGLKNTPSVTWINVDGIHDVEVILKLDLILLDIMMPAGGGIMALRNIRNSAKTFNIPVIVITAMSDKETKETAEKLGIFAYFVKPVDAAKLIEKIKEALQYK